MADGPVGGSWRGSTWWASSCNKTGVHHGVGGKQVARAAAWAIAATACGARVPGSRLVRWARSAHRDTRRLDASATFWRRCPNVHLAEGRLEVGRYSDYGFICKFSETLTTRTVMCYPSVAVKIQGTNTLPLPKVSPQTASCLHPSCARQGGRADGGREGSTCLVVAGWLSPSIHSRATRRKDEVQQSDL